MSITVNYKGERIAESAGNALTLLTAGKYLEADVLLSASGGGGEVDSVTIDYDLAEDFTTANATVMLEDGNDELSNFLAKHLGIRGQWVAGRTLQILCEIDCDSERSSMHHYEYVFTIMASKFNGLAIGKSMNRLKLMDERQCIRVHLGLLLKISIAGALLCNVLDGH